MPSSAPLPHLEEGIHIEERLGYNTAFQCIQHFNQARDQLKCELSKEARKLDHKYDTWQIKMERRHELKWGRTAQEGNPTLQDVFSMTSLAD